MYQAIVHNKHSMNYYAKSVSLKNKLFKLIEVVLLIKQELKLIIIINIKNINNELYNK